MKIEDRKRCQHSSNEKIKSIEEKILEDGAGTLWKIRNEDKIDGRKNQDILERLLDDSEDEVDEEMNFMFQQVINDLKVMRQ